MKFTRLSTILLLLILGASEGLLALRRPGAPDHLTSKMQGGAVSAMLDYYDGGLGNVTDPNNNYLPADKLLNKIDGAKKDNTYRRCVYIFCIHYEQYSPSEVGTIISKLIEKGKGSDLAGSSDSKANRIYVTPGYSSKFSKRTYSDGLMSLALRLSIAGQPDTHVVNIIRAILQTQVSLIIAAANSKLTSSKNKQDILYGIGMFVIMRIPENVRHQLFTDVHEFLLGINQYFVGNRRLIEYVAKQAKTLGDQFNTIKLPKPILPFATLDSILSGNTK